MKDKTVHSFNTIYGHYVDEHFVEDFLIVAQKAHTMARLHLGDCIDKDIHHPDAAIAGQAVKFWSEIKLKCKEYLK